MAGHDGRVSDTSSEVVSDPFSSDALARTRCYERFAARVMQARPARVLDLACGDGYLTALLPGAIGLDVEIVAARARGVAVVQGRAQQLPFADGAFDAVACHLAIMLFDGLDAVIGEIRRVLVPGGQLHAILGGGPVGDARAEDDAFAHLATLVARGTPGFGDRRTRSEPGWRGLFAGWRGDHVFERWPVDLTGSFEEVWQFLGAQYQLADPAAARAAVRAQFPRDPVPCGVAMYYARVTR
jgi:SAM-dependent methyltransferase